MPPVTINVYQNMRGDVQYPDGMAENERLFPPANNLAERGRPAAQEPTRRTTPGGAARRGAGPVGRGGAPATGAAAAPPVIPPVDRTRIPGNGTLFVGDKGYMATTERGEGVWLLPASRWQEYQLPPQILPRSVSHQQDWVRACKGGAPGCSNFDIAVPYIEWLVLGAIALRVPGKLLWDAKNMRFTNNNEANQYLRPYIRKGWELKL
jgi:hypothetical protein